MPDTATSSTTGDHSARVEKVWTPGLLRRFSDAIFGYDFFISYTHSDGRAYARELARRLEADGFNCFLDSDDYVKGDDWKRVGYWTLRCTSRLVLVGSPNVHQSHPVLREVRIFSKFNRQIVPISFGASLDAEQRQSPLFEFLDSDRIRIDESLANLQVGPSQETLNDLRNTFNLMRQSERRLRFFAIATVVFAVLSIAAVSAGLFALDQRDAARESLRDAQERWAASMHRPIGRDATEIDSVEWGSITELMALKETDQRVRLEFLERCLSTAPRARQLRNRMELVEHALFVEDRKLRNKGLNAIVLPRLAELEHSREPSKLEVQFACVELGVAMNATQLDKGKQFAQYAVQIIGVEVKEFIASHIRDLAKSQAANETEYPGMAINLLRIRTDGAFVVRMIDDVGKATESIAPTLEQRSASMLARQLLEVFGLTLDADLVRVTDLDDIGAECLGRAVAVLIPKLDREEIEKHATTVSKLMTSAETPAQLLALLRLTQTLKPHLESDRYRQLSAMGVNNLVGLIDKGIPWGELHEWHLAFRSLPNFVQEGMTEQAANRAAEWIQQLLDTAGPSATIRLSGPDDTVSINHLAEELVGLTQFLGKKARLNAAKRAVTLASDSTEAQWRHEALSAASRLLNAFLDTLDEETSSQMAREVAMNVIETLQSELGKHLPLSFSRESLAGLLNSIKIHLHSRDVAELLELCVPLLQHSDNESLETRLQLMSVLYEELSPRADHLTVASVSQATLQQLPVIAERAADEFKLSEGAIAATAELAEKLQAWIPKEQKKHIADEIVRALHGQPENSAAAPVLVEALCVILGAILPSLDQTDAEQLRGQAASEVLRAFRDAEQSPFLVTLADSLAALGTQSEDPHNAITTCFDLLAGRRALTSRSLDLKAAATIYRLIAPTLEPRVKHSAGRLVVKTIDAWSPPQRTQVAVSELNQLSALLDLTFPDLLPGDASGAIISVAQHLETYAENASNFSHSQLRDIFMRHVGHNTEEQNDRIANKLASSLLRDWRHQFFGEFSLRSALFSRPSWEVTAFAQLAPHMHPETALALAHDVLNSAVSQSSFVSLEEKSYLWQFDCIAGFVAPLVKRLDRDQLNAVLLSPACVGRIRDVVRKEVYGGTSGVGDPYGDQLR